MKFYKASSYTSITVTENRRTLFGRNKTYTYTTKYHEMAYIKSVDSLEQIKSNIQKKVPQDLKKWIEKMLNDEHRYDNENQKELWHTYHVAQRLFPCFSLPNYCFSKFSSIRRSKFSIYVHEDTEVSYIEEMKAKEVLEKFSVNDCVEVVGSILGVQP